MILLDLLFEKYYLQFLKLLLIKLDKKNIFLFLNYLFEILHNEKIKSDLNISILIKKNIPIKILHVLLNNANYLNDFEIYTNYKEQIIDCFSNMYINNSGNSNLIENLINQNKESFINLMNYKTKKEYIFTDIYKQNLYLEILKEIFSKENKIYNIQKEIILKENYFVFNGSNSGMQFYMEKFSLDNLLIIFSFQLNLDTNSLKNCIFPLISIETMEEHDILFEIIIKRENNINKLLIRQDNKNKNKQKNIDLKSIQNISIDTIYYLAITFKDKSINIYIKGNKLEKYHEKIDNFEIRKKSAYIKLKIGNNNDIENNVFKGYIGPLIFINNLTMKKNVNINDVINDILDLKNLYQYFPYFLNQETTYDFDNFFIFSSTKKEYEIKNKIISLQNNIQSFTCNLYITPEILSLYYSLFQKNDFYLHDIPNICLNQNKNIILKLNISTKVKDNIYVEFIRNNGLYYFCLIYEYMYQLFNSIFENKKEWNDLLTILIDKI